MVAGFVLRAGTASSSMVASSKWAEIPNVFADFAGFWVGSQAYDARCMGVFPCCFLHDEAIDPSSWGILGSYICARSRTSDSCIEARHG